MVFEMNWCVFSSRICLAASLKGHTFVGIWVSQMVFGVRVLGACQTWVSRTTKSDKTRVGTWVSQMVFLMLQCACS
jgi:hypothetical protein